MVLASENWLRWNAGTVTDLFVVGGSAAVSNAAVNAAVAASKAVAPTVSGPLALTSTPLAGVAGYAGPYTTLSPSSFQSMLGATLVLPLNTKCTNVATTAIIGVQVTGSAASKTTAANSGLFCVDNTVQSPAGWAELAAQLEATTAGFFASPTTSAILAELAPELPAGPYLVAFNLGFLAPALSQGCCPPPVGSSFAGGGLTMVTTSTMPNLLVPSGTIDTTSGLTNGTIRGTITWL